MLVSLAQNPSLKFSFAEWAFESLKPTPVNKKATPGYSRDITSMKGIEPPQPIKIGSLPNTWFVESKRAFFNFSSSSGAQNPSPISTTLSEILAPNVSSRYSSTKSSLSRFSTSLPFCVGANLIDKRSLIYLTIALPAIARSVGKPYIPITESCGLHQLFKCNSRFSFESGASLCLKA